MTNDLLPVANRDRSSTAHVASARAGVRLETADLPEGSVASQAVDEVGDGAHKHELRMMRNHCQRALRNFFEHSRPMRDGSDERLRWAREKAGYPSAADFIRVLGPKSASTYYGFENGSRPISLSAARRFAPLLKVRPEWLYEDDGPPEVPPKNAKGSVMIPRLSWVSAGRLSAQAPVQNVDIEDFIEVADLPAGDWVALVVRGNSMDRIAPDGATIVVNRKDRIERSGAFFVFSDEDTGVATFKRFRPGSPPRLQPFSTDPDEETLQLTRAMNIFGRVRRVIIDL